MKHCDDCGALANDTDKICRHCGKEFQPKMPWWGWGGIGIGTICGVIESITLPTAILLIIFTGPSTLSISAGSLFIVALGTRLVVIASTHAALQEKDKVVQQSTNQDPAQSVRPSIGSQVILLLLWSGLILFWAYVLNCQPLDLSSERINRLASGLIVGALGIAILQAQKKKTGCFAGWMKLVAAGWVLGGVVGVVTGIFDIQNYSNLPATSSNTVVYMTPTNTPWWTWNENDVRSTTAPAVIRPTPTDSCLEWHEIRASEVGATLCVWGRVLWVGNDKVAYYIKFTDHPSAFYFVGYDFYYPEVKANSCVQMTGLVQKIGAAPVMVLEKNSELLDCNR